MISLDLRMPNSAVPSLSVNSVISTPSASTPVTRSLNHVRAHGSTPLVRQSAGTYIPKSAECPREPCARVEKDREMTDCNESRTL